MLTKRGTWFLIFIFFEIVIGLIYSESRSRVAPLMGLIALSWFLFEWIRFQLSMRTLRQIKYSRTIYENDRPVNRLRTNHEYQVELIIQTEETTAFPFIFIEDRLSPDIEFLASSKQGSGKLSAEKPLELNYSFLARGIGHIRFEGIAIECADLQGFFYYKTFIREESKYSVFPPVVHLRGEHRSEKFLNSLPPPGLHRLRRPGGSGDLLELRDYRPGDPPKLIAWKPSARRQKLLTKELECEVPQICRIVIDTSNSVLLQQPSASLLQQLLHYAATIAHLAFARRDHVGITYFNEHSFKSLPFGRTARHASQVSATLVELGNLRPDLPNEKVKPNLRVAATLAATIYPEWQQAPYNSTPFKMYWEPLLDRFRFFLVLPFLCLPLLIWFTPLRSLAIAISKDSVGGSKRSWQLMFLVISLAPFVIGLLLWILSSLSSWLIGNTAEKKSRKKLAVLYTFLDNGNPARIAAYLHNDTLFLERTHQFLNLHHELFPIELFDHHGNYRYRSEKKIEPLCQSIQQILHHAQDNQLIVVLVDLFELEGYLDPLLRTLRTAKAHHHEVVVIAPWLPGIPEPLPHRPAPTIAELRQYLRTIDLSDQPKILFPYLRDIQLRYLTHFYHLVQLFRRSGIVFTYVMEEESVPKVIQRLDQMRLVGRGK